MACGLQHIVELIPPYYAFLQVGRLSKLQHLAKYPFGNSIRSLHSDVRSKYESLAL